MSPKSKLTEWLAMLNALSKVDTSGKSRKHVLTIDQARSLLSIMQAEGLNLSDQARTLDMPNTTVSKNMVDLGAGNGRDRKGMGLIELMPSALNMSHKLAYLTPKGRQLRDQLTKGTGAK